MNQRVTSSLAAALLAGGLWAACSDDATPATAPVANPPAATQDLKSEEFRREAHQKALASLRENSTPVLRLLDPVAAANAEDIPLRVPKVGPSARTALRKPLELARREASGIKAAWLSAEDGVVLHVHLTGLDRGFEHVRNPEARDDPRGVLYTLTPYLRELDERLANDDCADGCGITDLAATLRASFAEVGSSSLATATSAREDFAALATAVDRWKDTAPPDGTVASACTELQAVLTTIDASLAEAITALPERPELPWDSVAPGAAAAQWKRRPTRWGAERLRNWLQTEEAFGHEPQALFERLFAATGRLRRMQQRDDGRADEGFALGRPFDAAACTTTFDRFAQWAATQGNQLVADLNCETFVAQLGADAVDDAQILRAMVQQGMVEPSRRVQVRATPIDLVLVQGRAAPSVQALTLEIAIEAGTGHHAAARLAVAEAHHAACLGAAAIWVHGDMGTDDVLRQRIEPLQCGDVTQLVAQAEARPRAALAGLGWVLLGQGPADAAALDRYWWAPIGLVRDLAIPPAPRVETKPNIKIEELEVPKDNDNSAAP